MNSTRPLPSRWERLGRVTLRVREGPGQGTRVEFDAGGERPLRIGRSTVKGVNDLVLDDETVSATHVELELHPRDGVHLRDLSSRNGVFVGRVRLVDAWLAPGTVFRVGRSHIELVSTESIEVAVSQESSFGELFGVSPVMRERFATLEKFARTPLAVLITGETGTGKELAARGLHDRSARAGGPYHECNCATLKPELAESTLFGHRRGSFTGATDTQVGLFEAANGGTLFLDEVGEMRPEVQAKLLRALDTGQVTVVGDHHPRKVDVRVISATLRDLPRMMGEGLFREDLYHRLAQVTIGMPPLRERVEDILPLAARFLERLSAEPGATPRRLSASAREALVAHAWPGNVRQLRNLVHAVFFLAESEIISAADIRDRFDAAPAAGARRMDMTYKGYLWACRREYLEHHLSLGGSREQVAERLGISVETLRKGLRGQDDE